MNNETETKDFTALLIAISIISLPIIPLYFSSPIHGLLANIIVIAFYIILLLLFGIRSFIEMGIFCFILAILTKVIATNLLSNIGT